MHHLPKQNSSSKRKKSQVMLFLSLNKLIISCSLHEKRHLAEKNANKWEGNTSNIYCNLNLSN